MRELRILWLSLFVLAIFLPSYAHHLAVVVNPENAVETISSADLAKIFKRSNKRWSDGKDIVILLQGTNEEMLTLERLNKMSASQWRAFITEHKSLFVFANSDAAVLEKVEASKGAIGLVDVRAINGKVKVLRVDGRLPLESGYLAH